jgi:predicted transcriptional regulator
MKRMTPKEEEILSCFWMHGPLFIRELLAFQEDPKPHYNTLSTIVRVLEEKGYIGYKAYGNTYQYYAVITQEEYRKKKLRNIVHKYFGNSYKRVVSALIEEDELSIAELQDLIEEIKTGKGK